LQDVLAQEEFWRAKVKESQSNREVLIDNYECQRKFYESLNSYGRRIYRRIQYYTPHL